jgi:hypothetical protein
MPAFSRRSWSRQSGFLQRAIHQAVNREAILHPERGVKQFTRPRESEAADHKFYA